MAILLFKLRYVPDDEAQDVRELLDENAIDYYETSAGVLGISVPALWLRDDAQADKARQLIDEYQKMRQHRVREEYRLRPRTLSDMFNDSPIRYLSIIVAIIVIGYFMIFSFIMF